MSENTEQSTGVGIQKIYLKDCSFESPESPSIFSMENWAPKLNLQVDTIINQGKDDRYEVILKLTVDAKQGDQSAFLCEVQQAGVFVMQGFDEETRRQVLSVYCPTTLYPYAREQVSNMVLKGGFPAIMLQPLNFEQMYQEQRAQQAAAG